MKDVYQNKINKIRENCSFALELDIDELIEANEPVGW